MLTILAVLCVSTGLVLLRNDDLNPAIRMAISKFGGYAFSKMRISSQAVARNQVCELKDKRVVMGIDCDSVVLGINAYGEIVSRFPKEETMRLVLVEGCRTQRLMVDGAVPFPEVGIALAIGQSLGNYPYIARRVKTIDVSDPNNPKIEVTDSLIVDIGIDDHARRLRRLAQVMAYSESLSLDLRKVDLRFENQVIVEAVNLKTKENLDERQEKANAVSKPSQPTGG
ncbi:MAG: cell division protein FtsQ/DivIB [bacterium]